MDPLTIAKLWLAIRPVERIRGAIFLRKIRKASKRGELLNTTKVDKAFKEATVNTNLLIAFAGSIARHFLPWATALLAGAGVQVSQDSSPLVTLVLAVIVYGAMQGVSLYRQWRKNKA